MLIHLKTVSYKAVLLSMVLGLLGFTIALAASGDLDTTFNGDGWVITDVNGGYNDIAYAMAIQPDGKIVAAGKSFIESTFVSEFALARYNPNGSLDKTFNRTGKKITDLGGTDTARGVAIQPDGKIVVVGDRCDSNGLCQVAVMRHNAEGSFDTTFNTTGRKIIKFMGGTKASGGVAIQPNGEIIVGGIVWNGSDYDFAVYRLNADGSLDTTFSSDGKVNVGFGSGLVDWAADLVLQSDRKIVVSGETCADIEFQNCDFAVIRLNNNGSLDTTFSNNGLQTTRFGLPAYGRALALQADGKIVAVGAKRSSSDSYFVLARYNPDGTLDSTFNGKGKKVTNIPRSQRESAESIVIQADGKIVVGGWAGADFAMARYNSNGSLDVTFSGNGIAVFSFGIQDNYAFQIGLDSNGNYILAGYTNQGWLDPDYDFALARVLP